MARDDPEFRIRLPEKLKAEIEKAAKENNRSINAECVSRLEESFKLDDYDFEGIVNDIEWLKNMVEKLLSRSGYNDEYQD